MKSILLFYLLSIMLAVALGGMQVREVFFPTAVEVNSKRDAPPLFKIPEKIIDVSLTGLAVEKLWNIEIVKSIDPVQVDDESSWEMKLEKKTWVLHTRENPDFLWYFYGILLEPTGMAAIFYNEEEQWTQVHVNEMFKGLRLVKISAQEIKLRETSGKEWTLGLFYLKQDKGTVKNK